MEHPIRTTISTGEGEQMPELDGEALGRRVERHRHERPSDDAALQRYRERRSAYDTRKERQPRQQKYREQRGVRYGYRV
jgi:hypothetical protein